jgi:hypothetical protein
MAQATQITTTSRFHNLSDAALADALGYADVTATAAEKCRHGAVRLHVLLSVADTET